MMDNECLKLIKPLVEDTVYDRLVLVAESGDQDAWGAALNSVTEGIAWKKRQALVDADNLTRVLQYIEKQGEDRALYNSTPRKQRPKGMSRGATPTQAISDIISGSGSRQSSGIISLDRRVQSIRQNEMSKLTDMLHETRPTLLGLKRIGDGEYNKNLVRAIYDVSGHKATKEMQAIATAWKAVTKSLMNRFNKAGGNIAEFERFNIPLNHDTGRIGKVMKDEWITDAKTWLYRREGLDHEVELTDDEFWEQMYRSVSTDGAIALGENVGHRNTPKLGDSHQQFRYMQPQNGDGWLKYTEKYGKHSRAVDSMVEYIDTMSTSIAAMETLGSSPHAMLNNLVEHIRKVTKNNADGRAALASMDQIMAKAPGFQSTDVVGAYKALQSLGAHGPAAARNFQTLTKLGTAPITALTDASYSATTSVYNGMNPIRTFARHMKLLNPFSHEDRILAGKYGLILDYSLSRAAAINRFSDSVGYSAFHRLADMSVRASGLNHWTNAGKTAFQLEYLSNLGRSAKSGHIPKGMQHAFDRYGISGSDWTKIKRSVDNKGFVDPTKIGDQELTTKVLGMISEETSFAIPEPNARARSVTQLWTSRNTVANEWIKTATQFKSFGVSTMLTHGGRILNDNTSAPMRMLYATSLILTTSAMGAIVLQLKDIAKGRTAKEWDMSLAIDGMMQGGAYGVLGDLAFNEPDLFGGTSAFLTGPTVNDFNRLKSFIFDSMSEAEAKGMAAAWYNEIKPGLIQGAERNSFVTRLWYFKLAFERNIMNQVNASTDPDFYKKEMRKRKRLAKEGQGENNWFK